jgi:ATP-binding cassette subfamily B protein
VEIGNHDELMEKQGAYYQLYIAQARHAAEIAEEANLGGDAS